MEWNEPTHSVGEATESEDDAEDYITVYCNQQFKEKLDPMKEELKVKFAQLENAVNLSESTHREVQRVDFHYDEVCKAILQTNGFIIKDLESHNIFSEFRKMQDHNTVKNIKRAIVDKFKSVKTKRKQAELKRNSNDESNLGNLATINLSSSPEEVRKYQSKSDARMQKAQVKKVSDRQRTNETIKIPTLGILKLDSIAQQSLKFPAGKTKTANTSRCSMRSLSHQSHSKENIKSTKPHKVQIKSYRPAPFPQPVHEKPNFNALLDVQNQSQNFELDLPVKINVINTKHNTVRRRSCSSIQSSKKKNSTEEQSNHNLQSRLSGSNISEQNKKELREFQKQKAQAVNDLKSESSVIKRKKVPIKTEKISSMAQALKQRQLQDTLKQVAAKSSVQLMFSVGGAGNIQKKGTLYNTNIQRQKSAKAGGRGRIVNSSEFRPIVSTANTGYQTGVRVQEAFSPGQKRPILNINPVSSTNFQPYDLIDFTNSAASIRSRDINNFSPQRTVQGYMTYRTNKIETASQETSIGTQNPTNSTRQYNPHVIPPNGKSARSSGRNVNRQREEDSNISYPMFGQPHQIQETKQNVRAGVITPR